MKFANNPYTRIRLQNEEIDTYRGHLLSYERTYDDHRKRSQNAMRNANMDIHLLMTIVKEVRPWVAPGALDEIIREHIARRGVSPATNGLIDMIKDTRQAMFIPIARPIVEHARPSTPVTKARPMSRAFGVEEEQHEEEFIFGVEEVTDEIKF